MAQAETSPRAAPSDEPEVVAAPFLRRQWDRVAAWACVVVGAMALLIGWMGISDTPFAAEQIPFVISGGIGGVFFLGVGAMLWISADLHDEWRKLDDIEALLRERLAATGPPSEKNGVAEAIAGVDDDGEGIEAPSGNGRSVPGNRTRRPSRARGG